MFKKDDKVSYKYQTSEGWQTKEGVISHQFMNEDKWYIETKRGGLVCIEGEYITRLQASSKRVPVELSKEELIELLRWKNQAENYCFDRSIEVTINIDLVNRLREELERFE